MKPHWQTFMAEQKCHCKFEFEVNRSPAPLLGPYASRIPPALMTSDTYGEAGTQSA